MKSTSDRIIRVLLVDDHALFSAGVSRLLEAEPDMELVGTSKSIGGALSLVQQFPVDVVLLDYELGGERGSDFLRQAPEKGFRGRVLIVTGRAGSFELRQLVNLG